MGPAVSPVDDVTTALDFDAQIAEVEERLTRLISRSRTLWKEAASSLHPELQPLGYKLLSFIARAGTGNAHQLAELFETDKSVVSRQVRALEEFGLLRSRPDEYDGRLRVLTATPAALEALAEVRSLHHARIRQSLAALAPEELAAAAKVFRCLAEL